MTLRLLQGGAEVTAYEGRAFDLTDQPMRPGLAHELLSVRIDDRAGAAAIARAAVDGVPADLWAAIVIESERALRLAADAVGVEPGRLASVLDVAAQRQRQLPNTGVGRRLSAYARALRRGGRADAPKALRPVVPYHSLIAWQHSAAAAGVPIGEWAAAMLSTLPSGRVAWEAAAAERGQTLAEWVMLQAARRLSS